MTALPARVLVPARPDRVVEGVHAAADALYVVVRQGDYSHLLRIPAGTDRIEEVALPANGHIGEVFTDPRAPGVTLEMSSWVSPPTLLALRFGLGRVRRASAGRARRHHAADFTVADLQAKARDGVSVPLSLVQPKGASGTQVTVIEAYGSYGISELADFRPGGRPHDAGHHLRRSATCAAAASSAKPGGSAARTPTSPTPGGT